MPLKRDRSFAFIIIPAVMLGLVGAVNAYFKYRSQAASLDAIRVPRLAAPAARATPVEKDAPLSPEYFECPRGSRSRYGVGDESVFCASEDGAPNGRWRLLSVDHQRILVEGEYAAGRRVGTWTYYDSAGKVLRTEDYPP